MLQINNRIDPDDTRITHIGIQVTADNGEIWANVTRCNTMGNEISQDSKLIGGWNIGAVGRLIDSELAKYPKIVSLEVEANIEGARR